MITEFALDLRHARRRSGLSQAEVAFLANVNQATYSRFEAGALVPGVEQLCILALIYGRSFASYFEMISTAQKPALKLRLGKLPPKDRPSIRVFNRARTLEKLSRRLDQRHDDA